MTITTRQDQDLDQYLADHAAFLRDVEDGDPGWLRDLRREAIARFQEMGFPTARRGNEAWKYTNVTPIARTPFRYPFAAPAGRVTPGVLKRQLLGEGWIRLVFVDGRFQPALSDLADLPRGVAIANLDEGVRRDGGLSARRLAQGVRLDGDGFTALSTAFARDGALIHVAAGVLMERPIHLLHLATAGDGSIAAHPRHLVVVERGAEAAVIEDYAALGEGAYLTNAVTEASIGQGAVLRHARLVLEGPGGYHIGTTQARQAGDSRLDSLSVTIGGRLVRNSLNVLLEGQGAECGLNGLYVTTGEQHVDNQVFVDHAAPRAASRQDYRGILDGKSRAVFSGRILVRQDAQKTDARQSNKNLVLSAGAEVNTKPFLEIFADDVKCAHGATAGKLDERHLFYLQSRGLDREMARDILAHAFASEIVDGIPLAPVRTRVEKCLLRGLPGLQGRGAGAARQPKRTDQS